MRAAFTGLVLLAMSGAVSAERMERIDPAPGPEASLPVDASNEAVERSAIAICGTTRECEREFRIARDMIAGAVARKYIRKKQAEKAIAANTNENGAINWPWAMRSIPQLDPTGNLALSHNLGRYSVTCSTTSLGSTVRTTCRSY